MKLFTTILYHAIIENYCNDKIEPEIKRRNIPIGTGVVILSPTRELSIQTRDVLAPFAKAHSLTMELIIGGTNMKTEAAKLRQGKI